MTLRDVIGARQILILTAGLTMVLTGLIGLATTL
mgnify:CR=1 FL=1